MKWIRRGLIILGFTFQYTIPLLFFGRIIPYTHGEIGAGLTKVGVIALCVFAIIAVRKLKERVIALDKGTFRAIMISLIEAIPVVAIAICLRWLAPIVQSLLDYWYSIIPFFVLGRLFYIVSETLYEREDK